MVPVRPAILVTFPVAIATVKAAAEGANIWKTLSIEEQV